MPVANKVANKNYVWEDRALKAAFGCGLLATLLFVIAYSTEYWVYIHLQRPEPRSDERGEYLKIGHYHGLWRICREELWYIDRTINNDTNPVSYNCRKMWFSLPESYNNLPTERKNMELKMIDFRRSTISVGIIALVLSFISHLFTWYSLDQMRYIFKRLAGCLHLITGACCWVTLEVFRQMHMYEERNMKFYVPEFSEIRHGWSYNIVWIVLILFVIPGVVLLACSRKRKGRKARSFKEARENEPVHLGRI